MAATVTNQSTNFHHSLSFTKIDGGQKHEQGYVKMLCNNNSTRWRSLMITQLPPSKLGFIGLGFRRSISFGVFSGFNTHSKVFSMVSKNAKAVSDSAGVGNTSDKIHNIPEEYGTNLTELADECIGATTLDEFSKHIEKDPVLLSQFDLVEVPETIQILKALRVRYEIRHKIHYTDESLVAAAQLSYQFIRDQFLPDAAIYLIDQAGFRVSSMVQLANAKLVGEARELEKELKQIIEQKNGGICSQDMEKVKELNDRELDSKNQIENLVVTEIDIQHVISSITGIPVENILSEESDRLRKVEEALHTTVIKMTEELHVSVVNEYDVARNISCAVCQDRSVHKNPNRPIASFIFCGPTGSTGLGKLELAKALASCYFGSEQAMITLDMSEFIESHTVSKIVESPAIENYAGCIEDHIGQLAEAVRRRPYTVVLFDQIELAHPDVFNMILQILEEGQLIDCKGTIDFKNTIIIMTSNVGSHVMEERIGEGLVSGVSNGSVIRVLKSYFVPQELNSIDEFILFKQLTKLEVTSIAETMIEEVCARLLEEMKIDLRVSNHFTSELVDKMYNPPYGRKSLKSGIIRHLEDKVAEKMRMKEIKVGDSFVVDVRYNGIVTFVRPNVVETEKAIVETIMFFMFLVFFFYC